MAVIALGKDHNVLRCDFSCGAAIPPAMNDARAAKYLEGVPIAVISKTNVVNAADHLISRYHRVAKYAMFYL